MAINGGYLTDQQQQEPQDIMQNRPAGDITGFGEGVGDQRAPMSYAQYWNAFQDPNQQANRYAIEGMRQAGLKGYGANGDTSSLAGLTSLGHAQNAQAARIDTGQSQNLMGGQVANINALNAQAQGQGPSVAAETARQQAEANTKAQMAAIGSQRGAANSALGLRAAQDSAAQQRQQGAQNATMGRAQEAMAARQQLGGALSGATQQAQQGAQAQAQLSQQAGMQNAQAANQLTAQQGQLDVQTKLANLQAQVQAGQLNANEYNAYVQALLAQNNNDWGAQMNAMNSIMTNNAQIQGVYHGVTVGANNPDYALTSAGISGGAGLAAGALQASDKNLKVEIRSAERPIKDFMSQVGRSVSRFALLEATP
jgi:hypothetical protein